MVNEFLQIAIGLGLGVVIFAIGSASKKQMQIMGTAFLGAYFFSEGLMFLKYIDFNEENSKSMGIHVGI